MLLRQIYDAFYFARMKNVNRGGAAVLGRIPEPRELTIDDVIGLLDDPTLVALDTRADRAAFMEAHLDRRSDRRDDRTLHSIGHLAFRVCRDDGLCRNANVA